MPSREPQLRQLRAVDSFVHPPERRQRLADDLVHVVIAIGREPADEGHAIGRVCKRFVTLEQRLILRPRDRVIGIALGRWIFVGDGCPWRLLPGQMLILADPRVGHIRRRIIDRSDRLKMLLIDRLVIEIQAAVRQLAEAEIEIFIDRASVDDVGGFDLVAHIAKSTPVGISISGLSSIFSNIAV